MGSVNTDRIAGGGVEGCSGRTGRGLGMSNLEGEKDKNTWYPACYLEDEWRLSSLCLFLTSTRPPARQWGEASGFAYAPLILAVMASVAMETSSR